MRHLFWAAAMVIGALMITSGTASMLQAMSTPTTGQAVANGFR